MTRIRLNNSIKFDAIAEGNRRPVWEDLGTKFVVNMSVSDGLQKINGDFEIEKAPSFYTVLRDGKPQAFRNPGRYTIVRQMPDENMRVFGECGSSYRIIQRRDFCRGIDFLTERWPLEIMGMLEDGKTLIILLNAGDMEINGDSIRLFFLLTDTVDGGTSAKSVFTTLRMQCLNALVTSLKSAVVGASIFHRQNFQRDFDYNVKLISKMASSQRSTISVFDAMAHKVLTPEQANRVFEYAYRTPEIPAKLNLLNAIPEGIPELADIRDEGKDAAYAYEYYTERAIALREFAADLLEKFNDENPRIANTAWAIYNVVVESADFRKGSDSSSIDALFGQRAAEKKRAFEAAYRLV